MELLQKIFPVALRPLRRRLANVIFEFLKGREYFSRLLLFDIVMGFVKDCAVEGHYLEFGCADGGSLADAYRAARRKGLAGMKFFVFDSFEGLPEPTGVDADRFRRYQKGDYACDMETYKRNVRLQGVDLECLTLVPGWYNESLTPELKKKLPIQRAAVILIDCDLYESTVPVMDFIADYIQDGTVLIFDDWFSYKGRTDRGEARAFKEWLARNPSFTANEYHKTDRTVMSFIMQVDR